MFDHAPRPAVPPAVPALVAVLAVMVLGAPSAAAVADAGASAPAPAPVQAASARYQPPVRAPILDPFRAPTTRFGPGNRGIEYGTAVGDRVGAIGDGTVAFAGPVAGRLVVSVVHPDGLRSSLTGLARISVHVGQDVVIGQQVGVAAQRLHLGVRRGETYLDPASLFSPSGPARLVPRRR